MSKIIPFTGITKLDLTPENLFRNYIENDTFEGFVICGYTKEGEEFHASTYADGGTALWLLERCKAALMRTPDE